MTYNLYIGLEYTMVVTLNFVVHVNRYVKLNQISGYKDRNL